MKAGETRMETPAAKHSRRPAGHGWWPYVLPYLAFLLTTEVVSRLPDAWAPIGLFLKPAVPGALLIAFALRGAYPELRGIRLQLPARLLDVLVGLALAALWMAPYVLFDGLRPADTTLFDPAQLGEAHVGTVIALRFLGYGLVTPFFEEIFIRSFVMRASEVFRERGDFRSVPLARYSRVSFLATVVIFTVGHVPWEWWVAVPWVVLTNLWFYRRKDLYSPILVHATTNTALLAAAILWSDVFEDAQGNPISLWFFV
jgi:CAAX prenyl protease-like protein